MREHLLKVMASYKEDEDNRPDIEGIKRSADCSRIATPPTVEPPGVAAKLSRIDAILLSAGDVEQLYHISRATLYRHTAAGGHLRAVKVGRRTFWYQDSIREYLAGQPAPTLRAPASQGAPV